MRWSPYIRRRQSCTQCGLTMTSHNATRNSHDVMWILKGWQRQRRTCYRVQFHNVAWCSIYECLFELSAQQTSYIVILCTTKILLLQDSWNVRFLACFDRDMFRSKYSRTVRHWSFSMLCRWRHWGRGMHLLPLQRHTRETWLSTWLPMPDHIGWLGGWSGMCTMCSFVGLWALANIV